MNRSRHCDSCHHEFLGKDGDLCDWCGSSSHNLPDALPARHPIGTKQLLVSIWYRGIRTAFLVPGIIYSDGSTVVAHSVLLECEAKAGVYPNTTFGIGM